jgi:hypothetical protein
MNEPVSIKVIELNRSSLKQRKQLIQHRKKILQLKSNNVSSWFNVAKLLAVILVSELEPINLNKKSNEPSNIFVNIKQMA